MAEVILCSLEDAPEEGTGRTITFEHPITAIDLAVSLFRVEGEFYALADRCKRCMGKLGEGTVNGMYVTCPKDDTPWHVKKGLCKFDRTQSIPSYRVWVENGQLKANL